MSILCSEVHSLRVRLTHCEPGDDGREGAPWIENIQLGPLANGSLKE